MLFDSKLISRLASNGVRKEDFESLLPQPTDLSLEMLKARGLNIILDGHHYRFATSLTPVDETVFCIVDVETNGSKPSHHQIIEIGAVKLQNGSVIDTFESLVYCTSISEQIQEITGIRVEQTLHAPPMKRVLQEFRLFLGDAVFVGHDAKFDYRFVSAMMEKVGLDSLLNRSLCTIDLAERTIASERYGLAYLNEQLSLYSEATHHRALSDAMTTARLLMQTLPLIPDTVRTAEELLSFSKEGKRMKRPKPSPKEAEEIEAASQ